MTNALKIALAQLNPTVGAVARNLARARKARTEATRLGADLVMFTELYVSGYPPEDLVLKPSFVSACMEAVREFARDTADGGPAVLIGTPWEEGGRVYNAVALLDEGRVASHRFKHDLPNYGVFDEKRVFAVGPAPGPMSFRGVRVGVPICEDIWTEEVCETLVETGAEFLLVPNGSPYEKEKDDVRLNIAVARVTETGLPIAYVNQVGGQDELVFDGASFALNALIESDRVIVWLDGERHSFERVSSAESSEAAGAHGVVRAPMPGLILAVHVTQGDSVTRGQPLLVMEAMKMEHTLAAPADGTVKTVRYAVGEQVVEGAELVEFEAG